MPQQADAAIPKPPNNLGLVGYWSFNEGTSTIAHDFSGRGNNGTMVNMDANSDWVNGKRGKALDFDGSNDYILLPSTSAFDIPSGGAMTVAAWVKTTDNYGVAVSLRHPSGNSIMDLSIGYNGAQTNVGHFMPLSWLATDGSYNGIGSTRVVNDGGWHLLVAVLNQATNEFVAYVDGTAYANSQSTDGPLSFGGSTQLAIGAEINWIVNNFSSFDVSRRYLNGSIDEVRIYNRALTTAEVRELYNIGAVRLNVTRTDVVTDGLVGHWTFDGQDVSDKVYDRSGQGNHGSVMNAATTSVKVLGKIGQGASFDGIDDHINVGPLGDFGDNSTAMTNGLTWSVWFKTSSTSRMALMGNQNSSTGAQLSAMLNLDQYNNNTPGALMFLWTQSSNWGTYASSLGHHQIYDGKWHHWVISIDPSLTDVDMWLDGVELSVSNHDTGYSTFQSWYISPYLALGARINQASGIDRQFVGSLDEMRLYNRVLSVAEIMQLYDMGGGSVAQAPQNSKQTDGLIGLWSFDGADFSDRVYDRSGQGNHGYLVGTATSTARYIGKLGQGLRLNGTSGYVTTGASSTGVYTVSAWVKWNGGTNTSGIFYGLTLQMFVAGTSGNVTVYDGGAGGYTFGLPNISATPGVWMHIALTSDGTTAKRYINGELQNQATKTMSSFSSLQIGRSAPTGSVYFNGVLDDFRIYNRALSASEIKQLYNIGQ